MPRGTFKRPQNYRNPSNLHVIPIGSVLNNKPFEVPPMVALRQETFPSVIPVVSTPPVTDMFEASNYRGRGKSARKRARRRRERFANKPVLHEGNDYHWFNPNIIYNKNNNVADTPPVNESEATEVAEAVPEVPPSAEEDFEEVEVASSEGEGKKVPVGFRKNKLCYLNYKKNYFFKPKFYSFSSQRTVVNCLNVDDDDSVDVDVVSEAEYDEYEVGDHNEPGEKFGKIIEIEEESSNEVTDVDEEAIHIVNDEMEESSHVVTDEVDEDSNHTITLDDDMDDESTHAVTDEKSSDVTNGEVDKISTPIVINIEDDEKSVCGATDKVEKKSTCTVKKDSKEAVPESRVFNSSIENSDDLSQGESLIQEKLNTWESHLIGLEYLLEIRDKDKTKALKYYCTLCDQDLDFQELPEVYVINHISERNHITKYLGKHFPNCEFKIDENSSNDFVFIQKFCEKINKDLGYYFMCITNDDYYAENCLKIKETIQDSSHLTENIFKFEKSSFEKIVDSDLSENISSMVKDMVKKVMPEDELAAELEKEAKENKNVSKVKSTDSNGKKKADAPKNFKKHKGNNSISSFLRLSFAASAKLPKPKATSNKNEKTVSNKEQIPESSKSSSEQPTANATKTNDVPVVDKTPKAENAETLKKPVPKSTEEQVKPTEVPVKPNKPTEKPVVKPTEKPVVKPTEKPVVKPTEKPVVKPTVKPIVKLNKLMEKQIVKPNKPTEKPVPKPISSKEKLMAKLKILKGEASKDEEDTQLEDKESAGEAQDLAKTPNNSAALKSQKDASNIGKKGIQNKEKVLLKTTTMHSKHCRKRILDKGIARLRMAAAKASTKSQLVTGITIKSNVKSASTEKFGTDTFKKITPNKIKPDLKENKAVTCAHKNKPLFKVISVQKPTAVDSKISTIGHTSSYQKNTENSSVDAKSAVTSDSSRWIPMKAASPVLTSDISLFLKKISSGQSESSVKKRRLSKSPIRKITSPLRSTHSRRHSRSPYRKSRSPVRRSRSPKRRSRSPKRRSRSPIRNRSRSPIRRRSRSPLRRQSKSPGRRRSRSPLRRRSRSPLRRRSRSPLRRRSRSPLRRRSRSPLRKRSRSPLRKRSRSPLRRLSRSPLRRHSRSPIKRRSRSPRRKLSRSPLKRQSRSPYGRSSRSPVQNLNMYRNLRQVNSNIGQSSSSRDFGGPDEHFHRNTFNFPKRLDFHESEINRSRDTSKMFHSSKVNKSDRYKSPISSVSSRDIDLDPVSDEDESIYFSDKHMRSEDTNVPSTSKGMLSKLWQKISGTENSNEQGLNNLLQFMETHRSEIEEFISIKSGKSEKTNAMKIDSNLQQQTLLLQQFLLANLAGSFRESVPSVSNMQYAPPQPPFLPENVAPRFGPPNINMPSPMNMPIVPPQPAPMQPRFFPPNVSVPPPQLFQPTSQPNLDYSPKPKPAPEVMFKDLKATVNKLFGANEIKQGIKPQVPAYVTEPDPEKWDINHPNTQKFNVSPGPKNSFSPSGKNMNYSNVHESPVMREQLPPHNNPPEQFFSGSSNERPQVPNVPIPPPNAKVTFCESPRSSAKSNLFPVVNPNANTSSNTRGGGISSNIRGGGISSNTRGGGISSNTRGGGVIDVKVSLAQRLASVLVKIGMVDVPAPLLQEMLMKIGAFSSSPRQDISENEILSILKRLGYL